MAGEGSGRVLIVDDEPVVRNVLKEVLEKAGYGVVTAEHGIEALDRLKETTFDLAIIDVNMPKLDGIDLYRSSLKQYPYLKDRCLFITGDLSGELEAITVFLNLEDRVLTKPFRKEELLEKVAQVVNGNAGG